MKKGIYLLPNGLTLCGMSCGFFAILFALSGKFEHAAWAIIVANIFDGLDGWVARLTNSASRFGVQLDSLSDFLAFPSATAVLLYTWQLQTVAPIRLGQAAALFFVMCGALRLARYNVQAETTECRSFTGMPTPAAATTLAVCPLLFGIHPSPQLGLIMVFLTFLVGLLMVSDIRFRSLKEMKMKQRQPFWLLVAFVGIVFLLYAFTEWVIAAAAFGYMLWSLIEDIARRVMRKPHAIPVHGKPVAQAAPGNTPTQRK